jgi:hypothetical protein
MNSLKDWIALVNSAHLQKVRPVIKWANCKEKRGYSLDELRAECLGLKKEIEEKWDWSVLSEMGIKPEKITLGSSVIPSRVSRFIIGGTPAFQFNGTDYELVYCGPWRDIRDHPEEFLDIYPNRFKRMPLIIE